MSNEEILAKLLEESVKEKVSGKNIGIGFSGGIDSTTMAYLSSKYANSVVLYTVGLDNSEDVSYAKKISEVLGLPWRHIKLTEENVFESMKELSSIFGWIGDRTPVIFSFIMPIHLVLKNSEEKFIVLGQGSDEMFLGYHKFKEQEEIDFESVMKDLMEEIDRERVLAESYQKVLIYPFLDERIIEFSKNVPKKEKIGEMEKEILRKAAKILGVPEEAIKRRKKASQYGSGVIKIMKRIAKEHDMDLYDFIKDLTSKSTMQ